MAQTEILNNVFCGKCLKAVAIALETAKMQKDVLILRGKCKICEQEVCRVVQTLWMGVYSYGVSAGYVRHMTVPTFVPLWAGNGRIARTAGNIRNSRNL